MESSDKRELILQAAAKTFGEKGFHATKVEEIAEIAGVAKGTVYLYFKDKENILFEVTEYYMKLYLHEITKAVAQAERATDKLRAYAHYHLSKLPYIINFHKLNIDQILQLRKKEDNCHSAAIRHDQLAIVQVVADIVQYGIESGEFRKVDPQEVVMMFLGTLETYTRFLMVGILTEIKLEQADSLIDLMLAGIGSH